MTHPEDLPDPGTYINPETGDIWEKLFSGKWTVNGMPHHPFPYALVPEQNPATVWRSIPGFPRYEVNPLGAVRYAENHTPMAPSMQDMTDSYYPLMTEDHIVHMIPLEHILEETFPEEHA